MLWLNLLSSGLEVLEKFGREKRGERAGVLSAWQQTLPQGAAFWVTATTKRWLGDDFWEELKSLCGWFEGGETAVLIWAWGTLSKHCWNGVVHLKLCCLDKTVFRFLILLIFSKLWLSEMTWQVFPITVGPTSTWHHQCKLKGNAAEYQNWQHLLCLRRDAILHLRMNSFKA